MTSLATNNTGNKYLFSAIR